MQHHYFSVKAEPSLWKLRKLSLLRNQSSEKQVNSYLKRSFYSCRNLVIRLFLSVFIISETLLQTHFQGSSLRGGRMCLRTVYGSTLCNRSLTKQAKTNMSLCIVSASLCIWPFWLLLGNILCLSPLLFAIFSLKGSGSRIPPSSAKTWAAFLQLCPLAVWPWQSSPGNRGWNKENLVLGNHLHTTDRRREERERLGLRESYNSKLCGVWEREKMSERKAVVPLGMMSLMSLSLLCFKASNTSTKLSNEQQQQIWKGDLRALLSILSSSHQALTPSGESGALSAWSLKANGTKWSRNTE